MPNSQIQSAPVATSHEPSNIDAILSTGTLVAGKQVEGLVSIDYRGRFATGDAVRTSTVRRHYPAEGGTIVETRNSRYLVLGGLS